MKVLIAEDDRISAKVLQRAIEDLGHECTVTHNGKEALAEAKKWLPDVLVTDWMMPGMDGPELCRKVRVLKTNRYVYVIVLTAKEAKEDKLESLMAGADDFISKPLDKDELRSRLSVAQRILDIQLRLEKSNKELLERQNELGVALTQLRNAIKIADLSRDRFSQLFENLPVACFTFDSKGLIYEWNRHAAETFGVESFQAFGRTMRELLGKSLVGKSAMAQIKDVCRGRSFEDADWNNGKRFLLVSGHPLYGPDGTLTGGIATVVDVTSQRVAEQRLAQSLSELNEAHSQLNEAHSQLKVLNERLAEMARTDGLTGIPNHRALIDRLAQFVSEGHRGRRFAVIMVDVDHFKQFNDTYGHQTGDEVLVAVAQTLVHSIRRTDFVARYGGEEFCVILSNVSRQQALTLAEKLRAGVAAISNPYAQITASFGVACFGEGLDDAESILRAADEALYEAKATGRNRVVMSRLSSRDSTQAA